MRACSTKFPLYPLATDSKTASDWYVWLSHESIRRTIMTIFLLRGVYNYFKTGTDIPTVLDVYLTLQTEV